MKPMNYYCFIILLIFCTSFVYAQDATEIINKAEDLMRGKSSYSEMTMQIVRPKWSRTLSFKGWAKGKDLSLIYVTAPARDKGQVFLKRETEMWNWVPSIERIIKIPPSMMMQSWMGSDLTNDDLIKESSIARDYIHSIIGEDHLQGYHCWKIELTPKEDAPVVWGKIISWVSQEKYFTLKNEYYDEDGYLVNIETLSNIKNVGDRTIPTRFEVIPVEKEGQKTILEFTTIEFDIPIKDDFFSIQNLKRVR